MDNCPQLGPSERFGSQPGNGCSASKRQNTGQAGSLEKAGGLTATEKRQAKKYVLTVLKDGEY